MWKEDGSNVIFETDGDAAWFMDSSQTHDGAVVWRSGAIGDEQRSVLKTKVSGPGKISFWWKVDCEWFRTLRLDSLAFSVDGVEQQWINGEEDWSFVEFVLEDGGEHVLEWAYIKDEADVGEDYEDCGWVSMVVWEPVLVTLNDYLNCTNVAFTTSGDAAWFGERDVSHDGFGALQSGAIGDNGTSRIDATVEGPGIISFWWKSDCEASFRTYVLDHLVFYVDGVEKCFINDDSGWEHSSVAVGAGQHALSWVYEKDEEGSSGEDCAWLDEVLWMPSPVDDPIPVISSDDEVESALQGSTDANLTTFVTNVATYAEYREWAQSVKGSDGETPAGAAVVKASDKAWLSFALGSDKLIEEEITKEDVTIDSFEPSAEEPGSFSFEVSIKDVNIGSDAGKERLATVLGIEGSASLDDSAFSSGNVDFDIGTPKDGKATFTAKPKEEAKGDGGAFFMRIRVNQ